MQDQLIASGAQAQVIMDRGTSCYNLARDVNIFQNALCTSLLYAVDTFWLGFLVLSFTFGFSLITFIGVANAFADRNATRGANAQKVTPEDDVEQGGRTPVRSVKMPSPDRSPSRRSKKSIKVVVSDEEEE
jgi:hypothetical protein